MYSAEIIAKYFLFKDKNKKLFNNNVVENNNRKYLFLSQVVFLAKYEKKLFNDDFIAYDNGPVIKSIVNNYSLMSARREEVDLPKDVKTFLDKIYDALINASYKELIEISHEDPEWIKLSQNTFNAPVMNLDKNIEEYKERYKGLIAALKL